MHAAAGYLAQTIAQELLAPSMPPAHVLIAAYRQPPSSAFEGLNYHVKA